MLWRVLASIVVVVVVLMMISYNKTRQLQEGLQDGLAAYERGDYETAHELWLPLAEQGNVVAQNDLGLMYTKGEGVPQDYAEAVKWFRLAAEKGYDWAQNNLGDMYLGGRGVLQDHVQAHMWFNLAAAQGDTIAVKSLDLVTSQMSSKQLAEAERLAREWLAAR